ncbi:hypothetical protein C1H46_045205 [Malus baccata]|uniref:Uncharacterized protein n=1 Tax=Malus baccata TaxID=106549 RepID=A0A540K5U9_MALBA|nr:hypothetical protein C1H46_045205 [Malus baccata]
MAASSDGVSGLQFVLVGWSGFKHYKLVKFVKEEDNYAEKNVPKVMKFSWQSLYRKRTEPYDTLQKVWEAFDDLAPGFFIGPIIAFVVSDGALEVKPLPSFLNFLSCSKFFLCVMYSFFEKSVIPPSERKVELAPNHEIQETWMRSIHWTNEIKKIDD